MAIEMVSFPIKNGDFPVRYVSHYHWLFFVGQVLDDAMLPQLTRFLAKRTVDSLAWIRRSSISGGDFLQ